MNYRKSCLIIFFMALIICLANNYIFAAEHNNRNNRRDLVRALLETISEVDKTKNDIKFDNKTYKNMDEISIRKANLLYENMKGLENNFESDFKNAMLLYEGYMLNTANRKNEALEMAQKAIDYQTDLPEALQLKGGLINRDDPKLGTESARLNSQSMSLIPAAWGSIALDPQQNFFATGDLPSIPGIPYSLNMKSQFEGFFQIGELFESMGFYRKAIDSYVEAYDRSCKKNYNTEIDRCDLWMKIGELESREGQKVLAYRAFLKAAYLDPDKKIIDKAADYIADLMDDKAPPKHDIPTPIYDKDKVLKIAEIYRQMNLHPLGLALLRETEKATGVSFKEKEETMRAEWQKIMDSYSESYGPNCMILGNYRNDIKDWADAPILRPSDTFWKPVKNNVNLFPKD